MQDKGAGAHKETTERGLSWQGLHSSSIPLSSGVPRFRTRTRIAAHHYPPISVPTRLDPTGGSSLGAMALQDVVVLDLGGGTVKMGSARQPDNPK